MQYKVSFVINDLNIDAYAMEFTNQIPACFQIFVKGYFEGFIYPEGYNWKVDKYGLSQGFLTEQLAQEIGNYLMAYYS
jgi:hypothetical protein